MDAAGEARASAYCVMSIGPNRLDEEGRVSAIGFGRNEKRGERTSIP